MAEMQTGVLIIQAMMIGIPLAFILLVVRFVRAARAFNRHFQRTYPRAAEEAKSRWPGFVSMMSPYPMFQLSLYESDLAKDDELRLWRKKAFHSLYGLLFLMLALSVLVHLIKHG